jgi:hypothetical protein
VDLGQVLLIAEHLLTDAPQALPLCLIRGRVPRLQPLGVAHRRRLIRERGILEDRPHRVQAEAVHPHIQPEADDVEHRLFHRRVPPVEIRLLFEEEVIVILAGPGIVFPRGAAEGRIPVVRRPAVLAVAPDIPVPLRVIAAGAGFLKPRVLIGGVVEHQVQDHPDVPAVGVFEEAAEILQGPVFRGHVHVVRDIVTPIHQRGGVVGAQPDGLDPQVLEVIQMATDPLQVSDAISVRVREAAGVDLIEHGLLPPAQGCHRATSAPRSGFQRPGEGGETVGLL